MSDFQPNAQTPWGPAQSAHIITQGIAFFSTASHGGFFLAPDKLAHVSEKGRAFAAKWSHGHGEAWFEEDCAWAFVAEAFPEHFSTADRHLAVRIRQQYEG